MSLSHVEGVEGRMEVYHLVGDDHHGDDTRFRVMRGDSEVAARVWLASGLQQSAQSPEELVCLPALRYELVARLNGCDPEDAFRLTNTIDRLWTRNAEVEVMGSPGKRSTSVGDVVVVVATGSNAPMPMIVAPMGFEPLSMPALQAAEVGGESGP